MAGLADIDFEAMPEEAFEKMGTTRQEMLERVRQVAEREAGTPQAGSRAPNFEIERLSPDGQRTGETFNLSRHLAGNGGRPVALVFGSYT
jgi:hypothetical protein